MAKVVKLLSHGKMHGPARPDHKVIPNRMGFYSKRMHI